jgi:predicted DNA-binding protein
VTAAKHQRVAIPAKIATKLLEASKATRVPQTQILRELLERHLEDWQKAFVARWGGR